MDNHSRKGWLGEVASRQVLRQALRRMGERPRRNSEAMIAQAEVVLCDEKRLLDRWWALSPDERRLYLQIAAYVGAHWEREQWWTSRPFPIFRIARLRLNAHAFALIERLVAEYFLFEHKDGIAPISFLCPNGPTLPLEPGDDAPFPPRPFFRILAQLLRLIDEGALHIIPANVHRFPHAPLLTPLSRDRLEAEGINAVVGDFLIAHLLEDEVVRGEPDDQLRIHLAHLATYLAEAEETRLLKACLQLQTFLPLPPPKRYPPDGWMVLDHLKKEAAIDNEIINERASLDATLEWLHWLAIFSDGPFFPLDLLSRGLARSTFELLLTLLEVLGMAEQRLIADVPQVRLRDLQRCLWGKRPPTIIASPKVTARMEGKLLLLPLTASSRLHQEAQQWAKLEGIGRDYLRYRLDPGRLSALLSRGTRTEELAARWTEGGANLPPTLLTWWQRQEEQYGHVRLYPHVDWLSVRDPLTLRELQLAIPEMEDWIEGMVTPTDIILKAGRADEVLKLLRERHYFPREEE